MKKTVTIFVLFISFLNHSQSFDAKKFQVGVSYSLTNDDELYKNPFSANVNYQIKQWENLDVKVGFRAFYLSSKKSENFSNKWGLNPNVSSSYSFFENKLNVYLALGYYYDSYAFTPEESLIPDIPSSTDLETNGFTVTPGVKYLITSTFFVDSNVTILSAK